MNDQNQNTTNDLTTQPTGVTGTNGGMFTAPPPIPPVSNDATASNSTTDTSAPWADLMKDLPQVNEAVTTESSEIVEDNPFFRAPKVEEAPASSVVVETPAVPMQSNVTPNLSTSSLPEIKPEPVVTLPKTEVVATDIPANFNPVIDQIPESIMQQAKAPVMDNNLLASQPEAATPSWMTETPKPVVEPVANVSMSNEVLPVENLATPAVVETPKLEALPEKIETVAPVNPVAPVATELPQMPEPVKAIDATITEGPAFAQPLVEKKDNPPTIPPAPAVVSVVEDDEKDAKNHRVRDILLVLAVVVLGVLALALGVALATSVIP